MPYRIQTPHSPYPYHTTSNLIAQDFINWGAPYRVERVPANNSTHLPSFAPPSAPSYRPSLPDIWMSEFLARNDDTIDMQEAEEFLREHQAAQHRGYEDQYVNTNVNGEVDVSGDLGCLSSLLLSIFYGLGAMTTYIQSHGQYVVQARGEGGLTGRRQKNRERAVKRRRRVEYIVDTLVREDVPREASMRGGSASVEREITFWWNIIQAMILDEETDL